MRPLRSIPAALFVVLAAAPAVPAQQLPGRVFNPLPNPTNANLVAFELLDGDRRELRFLAVASGQVSSLTAAAAATKDVFSLPDLPNQRLSVFSGDLDWQPVATDAGRYWFAYVASDDQGVHLRLGSTDATGHVAAGEPLRIPFAGNVRTPRWAPNGKTLAFVSDSGHLYMLANVDQALRSGDVRALRPTRVAAAGSVLFPEWSPTGDHIAYQVEKTVNGARKFMIDVVPMDPVSGTARGTPATVSDALQGDNQYRPSWSPGDGANIAFYVDRASRGGAESQILDIAIVSPQRDRSRVIRGAELRKGNSPRIAEGVIAHGSRGPTWTRINDGGAGQLAIMFIQKDEAKNNPISVAGVDRWAGMLPRAQYTSDLSASWGTVNHKDVSGVEMDKRSRFAYVAVQGGGETVRTRDENTPWANGPAPVATVIAGARQGPVQAGVTQAPRPGQASPALSFFFPGGTQFARGDKGKGAKVLAVWGVGIGMGLVGVSMRAASIENAKTGKAEVGTRGVRRALDFGGAALAIAAWGYGIMDANKKD